MSKLSSILLGGSLTLVFLLPMGCTTDYKPIKASKCGSIVKHTAKILGKIAPSSSKMLKQCKGFTDIQRGCAMEAKSTGSLLKCSKL